MKMPKAIATAANIDKWNLMKLRAPVQQKKKTKQNKTKQNKKQLSTETTHNTENGRKCLKTMHLSKVSYAQSIKT